MTHFPLGFIYNPSTGYAIENAAVFNDNDSDYLIRTPTVAGNRRTWTWSSWIKRANLTGANQPLFTSGGDDWILFGSGETLGINTDGSSNYRIITSQVFRDPSAWFHVVIAVDTTNSTAGNRLRMYINGSEVTAFGTDTNPALNYETTTNNTTEHNIGKLIGASQYFDGAMAETHFVDGAALAATAFGELDSNGVWVPIEYIAGTPDSALSVSHTADAVSSSDLTTYTFSSQAIGTANAARVIAVGVNINGGTSGQHEISSITVGGVSLSQASKHQISQEHSDEIWYGTVPTGTSADVVVTANQATDRCAIDVWNVGNGAVLYASGDAGSATDVDTVSTIIDVPDGSVTVAHGHYSWGLASWIGLTEDSDRQMETTTYAGGASVATASATALTVTLDSVGYLSTGIGSQSFAAATFAPASNGAYGTNGFHLKFDDSANLGKNAVYEDISSYVPVSVNFDGTNDYLTRGAAITGLSDGTAFTVSFWVRKTGGDGTQMVIFTDHAGHIQSQIDTNNKINIKGHNSGASELIDMNSTVTLTATGEWHHVMFSTNTSTDTHHLYIDGVDVADKQNSTTGTIDLTQTDYGVGGVAAWGAKMYGDIADLYFTDEYIDLSSASNRLKFIDANKLPVSLGSDGSTPTGTAAKVYLNQNTLSTWHTNAGTGGGFTESGALTAGLAVRPAGVDFGVSSSPIQVTDAPTDSADDGYGNYCTWNGIAPENQAALTYTNGNLTVNCVNSSGTMGTICTTETGKWYYEITMDVDGGYGTVGLIGAAINIQTGGLDGQHAYEWCWQDSSGVTSNNSSTGPTLSTFTAGNVLGWAIDFDNDLIWCHKDGVWENGATLAEVEAGTATNAIWSGTLAAAAGGITPSAGTNGGTSSTFTLNCGQSAFDTAIPAGFKKISTANLPAPAVAALSDGLVSHVADASTVVAGLDTAMSDAGWGSDAHMTMFFRQVVDEEVQVIFSDDASNQLRLSEDGAAAAFNTLTSSVDYIGIAWRLGATYGMVTGTQAHTNGLGDTTVAHNLGAGAKASILKMSSTTGGWYNSHPALTANWNLQHNEQTAESSTQYADIDDTNMIIKSAAPTGTYRWIAMVDTPGFLSLREYVGNGEAVDGPFVNTGTRVEVAIMGHVDSSGGHGRYFHQRVGSRDYNLGSKGLFHTMTADNQGKEIDATWAGEDFMANGIKVGSINSEINGSGLNYYVISWGQAFGGPGVAQARAR